MKVFKWMAGKVINFLTFFTTPFGWWILFAAFVGYWCMSPHTSSWTFLLVPLIYLCIATYQKVGRRTAEEYLKEVRAELGAETKKADAFLKFVTAGSQTTASELIAMQKEIESLDIKNSHEVTIPAVKASSEKLTMRLRKAVLSDPQEKFPAQSIVVLMEIGGITQHSQIISRFVLDSEDSIVGILRQAEQFFLQKASSETREAYVLTILPKYLPSTLGAGKIHSYLRAGTQQQAEVGDILTRIRSRSHDSIVGLADEICKQIVQQPTDAVELYKKLQGLLTHPGASDQTKVVIKKRTEKLVAELKFDPAGMEQAAKVFA